MLQYCFSYPDLLTAFSTVILKNISKIQNLIFMNFKRFVESKTDENQAPTKASYV